MDVMWGVYELVGGGLVVWPLEPDGSGVYEPVSSVSMPAMEPLPISVHISRATADRALARVRYHCRGCA